MSEEQNPGSNPNEPKENDGSALSNIPRSDLDFLRVAKAVSAAWDNNHSITLAYIDSNSFMALVNSYENSLLSKIDVASRRPVITNQLEKLDEQIDEGIKYIKVYLNDKYGLEDSSSHYANYGIVKVKDKWLLPKDRDIRKEALPRIITAITEDGFGNKPFGLQYWNPINNQYPALMLQADSNDSTVSSKVSEKNLSKNGIKKVLNSLILVLKGNYPDSYQAVLREWGFMKEKY